MTRKSRWIVGIAATVVVALIAGAGAAAWLVFGGDEPAPVALTTLPSSASSSAGSSNDPLDGTWTIDATSGSLADGSSTYAGYRAQEEVSGFGANTAVGRTPDVSGTLALSGTQITSVEVTASLQTLKSDDDRRDGQLRRQAIETSQFPEATFKLTSPIELGALPADGETFTATATGELTLHGVTRTVEVPIEARMSGDVVTVAGSIAIQFADYDIERPTSFVVLSIEDHGVMEFQLHFRHQ